MSVKLISITKPIADDLKEMSPEELTSFVARVSNPLNQKNLETAPKLLGYCLDHGHFSVFEHVSFTVEITTSIAISAQILRHRSAVFQQFSARYSKVSNFVEYPARSQDNKNRQNSIDNMKQEDKDWFSQAQKDVWQESYTRYEEALARGVAKELARGLLPQNTETTMYMTNNLRNWIHYVDLRTDVSTQKEHRDIAEQVKQIMIEQFPNIAKAKGWIE